MTEPSEERSRTESSGWSAPLARLRQRLANIDWHEDSKVTVVVQQKPGNGGRRALLRAFGMLPPWGRVLVAVGALAAAAAHYLGLL